MYAESSAVLAWLRGEEQGTECARILSASTWVVASDLTLMECDRVLIRALALGEATEAETSVRQAQLRTAAASWQILRIGPEVVDRVRQPLPAEPVRTLDAIHLASAQLARSAIPDVALLSLDDRIRKCAGELGLPLQPPAPEEYLGAPVGGASSRPPPAAAPAAPSTSAP